jgi:hypothetical protein
VWQYSRRENAASKGTPKLLVRARRRVVVIMLDDSTQQQQAIRRIVSFISLLLTDETFTHFFLLFVWLLQGISINLL